MNVIMRLIRRLTSPRFKITALILFLYGALWVTGLLLLMLVGPIEMTAWSAGMALIAFFAFLASLSIIRPATMILSTFNGDIDKLDARSGNTTRGIAGTHIVLNFPPQLTEAIFLPVSAFTVPLKPINGITREVKTNDGKILENATPVKGILEITIRLPKDLDQLVRIIENVDFISGRDGDSDLIRQIPMEFYRANQARDGVEIDKRDCFKIAEVISRLVQPTIDEALSQVLPEFPLSVALGNRKQIESALLNQLQGTLIEWAGFLSPDMEQYGGKHDFNLMDIVPTDTEAAKAISAGTRERYNALGRVERAFGRKRAEIILSEGTAQAITNKADAVRNGGEQATQVLAAQAISDAASKNATFVAGLGLLDAGAAALTRQSSQQPPEKQAPPPSQP